jgi:hypothetical protein
MYFTRLERIFRSHAVPAVGLGLAILLAALVAAQTQIPQGAKAKPTPPAKTARSDAVVPFRAGERISYRVLWSKYSVNAGNIDFAVVEHRDFFGHSAWHFRATAQTVNTMRIVYPLDDQFDSYTDASQLTSLQYEMYLHEQGKEQSSSWRMISDGSPAPRDVSAARVLPGTRDVIGLLYALRAANWKSTPEFHAPVFDGRNLYDVVARLADPSVQITLAAGTAAGSKIDLRVFQHGEDVAGTHFSVWLALDAARTPLLVEAELPIGTARVEATALP